MNQDKSKSGGETKIDDLPTPAEGKDVDDQTAGATKGGAEPVNKPAEPVTGTPRPRSADPVNG